MSKKDQFIQATMVVLAVTVLLPLTVLAMLPVLGFCIYARLQDKQCDRRIPYRPSTVRNAAYKLAAKNGGAHPAG